MPKVFISYSWEDDKHKKWVKSFANQLLNNGFDATLDQYDLSLGDRLPQFMEKAVTESDYVLIICTPTYKSKSDNRTGGVGYEGHIITGELLSKGNERKFIPIIRKGDVSSSLPIFLSGKLAIDLKEDSRYDTNFMELITSMSGQRRKPPVKIASLVKQNNNISHDTPVQSKAIHVLGIITDKVTVPKMDGTRGSALYKVPFRLSRMPSELWKKAFIYFWNNPPHFSTMHRPGIATVYGDEIVLDGTTIEEVRDYHRETLILCVEEANRYEKQEIEKETKRKEQESKRIREHYSLVDTIASSIEF